MDTEHSAPQCRGFLHLLHLAPSEFWVPVPPANSSFSLFLGPLHQMSLKHTRRSQRTMPQQLRVSAGRLSLQTLVTSWKGDVAFQQARLQDMSHDQRALLHMLATSRKRQGAFQRVPLSWRPARCACLQRSPPPPPPGPRRSQQTAARPGSRLWCSGPHAAGTELAAPCKGD